MEWYEWFLLAVVWSLIPMGMYLKKRQMKRFERWQKEDIENIRKIIKGVK